MKLTRCILTGAAALALIPITAGAQLDVTAPVSIPINVSDCAAQVGVIAPANCSSQHHNPTTTTTTTTTDNSNQGNGNTTNSGNTVNGTPVVLPVTNGGGGGVEHVVVVNGVRRVTTGGGAGSFVSLGVSGAANTGGAAVAS